MPWMNDPLVLYHGTTGRFADAIANYGIDLARCRPFSDFGQGFYTTPCLDQAKAHANNLFGRLAPLAWRPVHPGPDPVCAAYITFAADRCDLAALDHLAFVSPTADWRSFVGYCRGGGAPHIPSKGTNYDVVYGPIQWIPGIARRRDYDKLVFIAQMQLMC